jgi:hypothetical protein
MSITSGDQPSTNPHPLEGQSEAGNGLLLNFSTHVLLGDVPGWLVQLRKRHEPLLFADEPDGSLSLRLNGQQVQLGRGWTHENSERLSDAPSATSRAPHTASNQNSISDYDALSKSYGAPTLPAGRVLLLIFIPWPSPFHFLHHNFVVGQNQSPKIWKLSVTESGAHRDEKSKQPTTRPSVGATVYADQVFLACLYCLASYLQNVRDA